MTLAHTVLVIAPQHIQLTAELAGLDALQPDFEAAEAEVETSRNKAIDEELRVITARRKLQRDWNRKIDQIQANSGSNNIIVQRLVPPPKPDETQVEGYACASHLSPPSLTDATSQRVYLGFRSAAGRRGGC